MPRLGSAWAASYDRLRRFDLADRAYGQAVGIVGPTVEILNNQGFSYMLRGDYKSAHAALVAAQRKDPTNKFVQNNLRLLEVSYRKGKSVE
ncbi:MAG: tetratricopeptide repeat protein [Pseudolabrys sp.]|jgi:Flp pilus assembly protein TadD